VRHLIEDLATRPTTAPEGDDICRHLDGRGVRFTTWAGWERLDAHEIALGEAETRERVKVVDREDMLRISIPEE